MHGLAFLSFVRGCWRATKRLFANIISAVLGVSLSWFTANPVGYVINRIFGDIGSLDQSASRLVMDFLDKIFKILLQTGAVSFIIPIVVIPAAVATVL